MKCLTIRQPWPFAIFHLGKDVENRTWQTDYRGPLLIHAGSTFNQIQVQVVRTIVRGQGKDDKQLVPPYSTFDKRDPRNPYLVSALIGTVDLVDIAWGHDSPWYFGKESFDEKTGKTRNNFAWVLANPRPFATPIHFNQGQLGLFDIDDALLKEAA